MPGFLSGDQSESEPAGRALVFKVLIVVEEEQEGYYGHCPDLGCIHVYGDSSEEARGAAKDAVASYLTMSMAHGDPIPIGVVSQNRAAAGRPRWWSSPIYSARRDDVMADMA